MEMQEVKEVLLNEKNIDLFVPMDNQRRIRQSALGRIKKALLEGEYIYENPIFANKLIGSKYFYVIDGNHRILAIRELLKQKKLSEVKIYLILYNNLSAGELKRVYSIVAKQTPQSLDDVINLYKDNMLLWEILNERFFPVKTSIYGKKNSITLKRLITLLAYAKYRKCGFSGISREDILNTGLDSSLEDYDNLKEFLRLFISVFGNYAARNRYGNPNIIIPLYYIWFHNKDRILEQSNAARWKSQNRYFWANKFEKLIGDTTLIELSYAPSGRETRLRCAEAMLRIFNTFPSPSGRKIILK